MSDFWRQCEGQVIDNRFRLRHYLGGTDDSAVFLTQFPEPQSQKAVIKFTPAGPNAEAQISLWLRVMQLSHPNLLRIFDVGRCRLENRDRLYVVMEYAEEDLSQIIPVRSLSPSESREMLEPILDVLVYLHGNGLVHSRIRPSNILAAADQLKLSSDSLAPIGESRKATHKFDAHDAPETAASPLSPAADVWSLGMTLLETLTQRTTPMQPGSQADPAVPDTLPQPLLDVARHSLRRDPRRRWTVPEIAARLNPIAVAAAASQAVSPVAVPLSSVPAVPAVKLQTPSSDVPPAKPKAQPPSPKAAKPAKPQAARPAQPKQTLVLPNYVVPVAAVIFVIVAIIALPKILGHRPESSSSASTAAARPAAQPSAVEQPARREVPPAPKASAASPKLNSPKTTTEKKPEKNIVAQAQPSPVAAPTAASVRTDSFPSANAPSSTAPSSTVTTASARSASRAEVLEQVLPDASEKALASIHGTVRVSVRVQVDPTGNVSEARLDSAGPSQYFADLALKAARRWQFTSPEVNGHSVPSEWLIRFHFTPSGPKAIPTQTAP
jgi:eukaryotic-like serine/threonine-protein kinase